MSRLLHARYEPREELGRGAQGTVVRVVDREAPERGLVAKVWNGGALSPELLRGEFALLSRLQIPGLVRAYDLGRDERSGAPFLVEEWIDGPDAREWLALGADLRDKRARLLRLLADVAGTLAELHDAGFLHGDLKPAHVRLSPGGRAVLLDLGAAVARARSGRDAKPAVAVSEGFAAPELLAGAAPSPASDAYAFGALGWTLATGQPPSASRARLRDLAPWMIPSLAELIERLLRAHPQDRRADLRQVLAELGALMRDAGIAPRSSGAIEGVSSGVRERELSLLERPNQGVRYLEGAAGMGKSLLLRELVTRAKLSGRDARLMRFPCDEPALVTKLIGFFRGVTDGSLAGAGQRPSLLALDDLQSAPSELVASLDALRCRPGATRGLDVIAAVRTAPEGSEVVQLGALGTNALGRLARELGANDEAQIAELAQAARGNPGWVAAALGRVPLTRQAALDRAEPLSSSARKLLALFSVLGGEASESSCESLVGSDLALALSELLAAGLVTRRSERHAEPADGTTSSVVYGLGQPALAGELAEALADFELVDRVADLLLGSERAHARSLLALSAAPNPASRRSELLRKAAELAKKEGLRSEETDALLALGADPRERTRDVLLALDRVTRGGGSVGLHPEVVGWLEEAAERDPTLAVLALRRRAEQRARAGELEKAAQTAAQALELAERENGSTALALAWSTVGSVALFRADWTAAESAIEQAYAKSGAVEDSEEVARLFHNRGVIALFRHRLDEARAAFERSLDKKRALGDRGGVWACLLNLGIALAQSARFEDSERALGEALALTRALGQRAGTGWCLAALADLSVRRGDARAAERFVAEAEHLFDVLPAAVHADVCILRAEIALLEGDGRSCLSTLAALSSELRARDALVDARALAAEARGVLIQLPSDRRAAARRAIQAVRRARQAGLPELERRGLEVLRAARRTPPPRASRERYHPAVPLEPDPLWSTVEALARGDSREQAALELATRVLEQSGAERAFVALATESGELSAAWGIDLDKLPIAEASRRLPKDLLNGAFRRNSPLYQPNVESPAGRGSRLAIASPPGTTRGLVVAEHRFLSERFDAVSDEQARRWATLAALLARIEVEPLLAGPVAQHSTPPAAQSSEPTTALPLTARSRNFPALVGASSELERALLRLDAAIESELPVLISGETGVGKELFARALHENGERARAPFVAVSCGAIPDSLFEAELFGHARGSFTGADRARAGLLARAEAGTLFLDEVGELPLLRQATLLRAISTGSYRPVGSDEERRFDVRVVAATNRELEQAVSEGRFRQDLYYRLNVLEIRVPPLRERSGDIARLSHHFLKCAGSNAILSPLALQTLEAYAWPGNVRELEHQMQRLSALRLDRIEVAHLSREIREGARRVTRRVAALRPSTARLQQPRTLDEERDQVQAALQRHRGNITHAARELGVTRQGLKKRMLRLGLRSPVRDADDRTLTSLRDPRSRVKEEER